MAKKAESVIEVIDPSKMSAETPADYAKRAWAYFSVKQFDLAAADFRKALSSEANDIDSWYGLGLTLKSAGTNSQALEAFEKVLGLIPALEDHQRAAILSRLSKGQINMMKSGNWDLEKEVWKHV